MYSTTRAARTKYATMADRIPSGYCGVGLVQRWAIAVFGVVLPRSNVLGSRRATAAGGCSRFGRVH
jgi:hypothetical protein